MISLKEKLEVDFRPYKILGACNPPLAYRALSAVPEAGLLLPCNVTVSFVEEHVTEVSIVDPLSMLGLVQHPDLEPIAEEARARLDRVAAALARIPVWFTTFGVEPLGGFRLKPRVRIVNQLGNCSKGVKLGRRKSSTYHGVNHVPDAKTLL